MNPDATALLEQLRDIHAAPVPGWWPPAPGWWAIGLLGVLALAFAGRWLWRQWRALRRRRSWLQALDELRRRHDPEREPREFLAGLNRVFRAVALRAFPGSDCARLEGEAWVSFVRERLGGEGAALDALGRGPYQPRPRFDAAALDREARRWVQRYG